MLPADIAHAIDEAAPALGPFAALRYVAVAESTNDLALALATVGEPEGVAVLAGEQRSGRGRRGRQWFSPPGAGLYLSVILRPAAPPGALSLVTIAAGVAAARAIERTCALPVELKWPNDLVIGRPWRKIGGVLCEGVGAGIEAVVVGTGVNLQAASYPRDVADRATSIEVELGRPVDRAPIVVALLEELRRVTERLRSADRAWVCDEWRRLARAGLGARVRWRDHQEQDRSGRARDIDASGALLVDADGMTERLIAGEVIWEQLSRE
jgi:BirA family biotin operon repressor/biotin-[acetyl-CoA-carboxylase] ligase